MFMLEMHGGQTIRRALSRLFWLFENVLLATYLPCSCLVLVSRNNSVVVVCVQTVV
jgi:hypothetical protein